LILTWACNGPRESNANAGRQGRPVPTVDAVVVNPRSVQNIRHSTGTFVASEYIEIRPEVSGRIIMLNFDDGDYVRKGSILAKMDQRDILSEIKRVEVDLDLAESLLARADTLLKIDALSKEEYDQVRNRVASLKAEKEILLVNLDKTEIVAPFSGLLGLRDISEGAYVQAGQVLTTLHLLNPIKLDFAVPERYSRQLKIGDQIEFTVAGLPDTFAATVMALDPQINVETRSRVIRTRATNKELRFLPGGYADVIYSVASEENALMIPSEGVIPDLEGNKVFLYKNGRVIDSRVNVGIRTNRMAQITTGVDPGDTVLISGLLTLNPGMSVNTRIVKPVE
jgi:membrane fusion protein (multidrug efflux system)